MTLDLARMFQRAVINITSKQGQEALLGTASGTVYYNDGHKDHLDRVWVRMGAENQVLVVAKVDKKGIPNIPGLVVNVVKREGTLYVDSWEIGPASGIEETTTGAGIAGHVHDYNVRNVKVSEYAGTPAGSDNVVVGHSAGDNLGDASAENVIIGSAAGSLASDDAGSVVIGYGAGGAATAPPAIASFSTPVNLTQDAPAADPVFYAYGLEASHQWLAQLTADLHVYCYYEVTSPYKQYVQAYSISGDTYGSKVAVSDTDATGDVSIVALSSTRFLILYLQYVSGVNDYYLYCRSATVTGTTISLGTETEVSSAIGLVDGTGYWDIHAARIDDTHAIITYGDSISNGSGGFSHARIVTVSGSTVSFGTADEFTTDQITQCQTVLLSSTLCVTVYNKWNAGGVSVDREIKAVIGDISGTSITYRATLSTLLTDSNDHPKYFNIATIDSTRLLLSYERTESAGGHVAICTIDGDDVTIGTPAAYGYPYGYGSIDVGSSSYGYVIYTYDVNDSRMHILTFSGSAVTVGDYSSFTDGVTRNYYPLLKMIDSDEVFVIMETYDYGDTYDRYIRATIANLDSGSSYPRSNNVFVGAGAGGEAVSNGVCLGHDAGQQGTENYRLYIDVTNTLLPLIYGEFDDRNVGINGADMAGGRGVIFIANSSVAPTGTPTGGGILYVQNGALKYKGSSGTVTTLGVA